VQAFIAGRTDPTRLGNPNTVIAAYIIKAGDTPESISQHFYKTPDHAVDILRANKLSWYTATLTAGHILIIPALATQSASQGV
jgi:nucleoid-associated protein YgaU